MCAHIHAHVWLNPFLRLDSNFYRYLKFDPRHTYIHEEGGGGGDWTLLILDYNLYVFLILEIEPYRGETLKIQIMER